QIHNNLLYTQGFQSSDALANRRGTANQGGLSEFWFVDIWNQSQCLFVALGNGAERTGSAVDALVVASHCLTVLLEHRELVLQRLQVTAHITGIAILRYQLQRHLLTAATDQDWNMRFLHPFWLVVRAAHLVILPLKGRFFLFPHS